VYDPSRKYAHGNPFQNAAKPSFRNALVHVVMTPLCDVWTLVLTSSIGCVKLTAKTAAEPPNTVDWNIVGFFKTADGLVAFVVVLVVVLVGLEEGEDDDDDDDDDDDGVDDDMVMIGLKTGRQMFGVSVCDRQ
jgi:hypothetical protein